MHKQKYKKIPFKDLERMEKAESLLDELENQPNINDKERSDILEELKHLIAQLHKKHPVSSFPGYLIISYIVNGGDIDDFIFVLEKLTRIHNDIEFRLFMGQLYLKEGHICLAHRDLEYYYRHVDPENLEKEVSNLYQSVKEEYNTISENLIDLYGISTKDMYDNEFGQIIIKYRNIKDGLTHFARLARKSPHFLPAVNNFGLCLLESGRMEDASEQYRKVLEADSRNTFALVQLSRLSFYLGDRKAFGNYLNQLESSAQPGSRDYLNLFLLNAYKGEHRKIIDLYRKITPEAGKDDFGIAEDGILFYAGVAYLETGKRKKGTVLLKKISSSGSLYGKMASLNISEDETFYFTLQNLFPQFIVKTIMEISEVGGEAVLRKTVQQNKTLFTSLLPVALENGDQAIRDLYTGIYDLLQIKEWNSVFSNFLDGKKGTKELRMKLHRILVENGYIEESTPLNLDGEVISVKKMRINDVPRNKHFTKKQNRLYETAYNAMRDKNYGIAAETWEILHRECPGDPSIINNLAATYEAMGKHKKTERLIGLLEKEHPDYFFYKVFKAGILIDEGKYPEAMCILQELSGREEYHSSEMQAYLKLSMAYSMAVGNFKEVLKLQGMMDEMFPEEDNLFL